MLMLMFFTLPHDITVRTLDPALCLEGVDRFVGRDVHRLVDCRSKPADTVGSIRQSIGPGLIRDRRYV